jgi:hypothetical protein
VVDLGAMLAAHHRAPSFPLEPGDTIVVP